MTDAPPAGAPPGPHVDPEATADLVATIGDEHFFDRMRSFVSCHVPIDNCVVVVFTLMGPPLVLHQWSPQEPNYFRTLYAKSAYQLDPFYLASLDHRRDGIHLLSEVSPDHFTQSGVYESYYRKVRMIDEIGLLTPYDRHLTIHLSMGRREGSQPYSTADLAGIRHLGPILRVALLRHCGPLIERALHAQSSSSGSTGTFARMLMDRWEDPHGITMREAEVAALVLRGHSNSSIGLVLDISPETVKVHRKNLYAKLKISSPSELFLLFMKQMMPGEIPSDP